MFFGQLLFGATFFVFLIIGIFFKDKVRNFKDYSIGKKRFSTPVLIATTIATLIGSGSVIGTAQAIYEHGVPMIFVFLGTPVGAFLTARFFIRRLKKYYRCFSSAQIIGSMYGKKPRIMAGVSSVIFCMAVVAVQIKGLSYVVENIFLFRSDYAVILSFFTIILYTTFGGVSSVIKTDVIQFLIFAIALPIIVSYTVNFYGGVSQIISSIPENKLGTDISVLSLLGAFLYYLAPNVNPPYIHRVLICKNYKNNINIAYSFAAFDFAVILFVSFVAFIAIYQYPNIESKQAFFSVVSNALGEKFTYIFGITLLCLIVSTADSLINTGASIFANDLGFIVKRKNSEQTDILYLRVITFASGIFSLMTALYFNSIFEIIMFFVQYQYLISSLPLLFGLMIKKKNPKMYYGSVFVGVIVQSIFYFYYTNLGHGKFLISIVAASFTYFFIMWLQGMKIPFKAISITKLADNIIKQKDIPIKTVLILSIILTVIWQIFTISTCASAAGSSIMKLGYFAMISISCILYYEFLQGTSKYKNLFFLLILWYSLIFVPIVLYLYCGLSFLSIVVLVSAVSLLSNVLTWGIFFFFVVSGIFFGTVFTSYLGESVASTSYGRFLFVWTLLACISIIAFVITKKQEREKKLQFDKLKSLSAAVISLQTEAARTKVLQKLEWLSRESGDKLKQEKIDVSDFVQDINRYFLYKDFFNIDLVCISKLEPEILLPFSKALFYQIMFSVISILCKSPCKKIKIVLSSVADSLSISIEIKKKKLNLLKGLGYFKVVHKDSIFIGWKEILVFCEELGIKIKESRTGLLIECPYKKHNNIVYFK
jgi:solute:Na+ symporter, SSS family